MTTTDTQVQQLIVNRLTKTQFDGATPSNTELWAVDPQFNGNKILATDSNGEIVETTAPPLTQITGYDASATQTLKNVNGTFTWVTDS